MIGESFTGLLVRSECGFLCTHIKFFSTAETIEMIGFCFELEPVLCDIVA
jgi:hypothetical protein